MEKLTIAIVAYNSQFFEKSLVSVLHQTYKDFKLYVLDDSMDGKIGEITEKYKQDSRLNYIKNAKNVGEAQNTVNAIKMCDTEYLWIFHDDDTAEPNLAEMEVRFLEEHTDVLMVSCNYYIINEYGSVTDQTDIYKNYSGKKNENAFVIFDKDELIKTRHKSVSLPTPAKIYKTEAFKDMDFSVYLRDGSASDAVLEFLVNRRGKAALLEERLLKYRIHPKQDSTKNKYAMRSDYIRDCIPIVRQTLPPDEADEIENTARFRLLAYEIGKRFNNYTGGKALDFVPEQAQIMGIKEELPENAKNAPLLYFAKKALLLKDKFPPGKAQDYIVWGAGGSGTVTYETLKRLIPSMNCTGFLDKFKTGEYCGLPVYHPKDFIFDKKYYIMVCTTPGAVEAYQTLTQNGYAELEHFYYGYGFDF